MSDEFQEWYAKVFDQYPGANEHENIQMVKRIWNSALETAARRFSFENFDMYTGDQVAEKLRGYQE